MNHWEIIEFYQDYAHITSPTMASNDPELFKSFSARKALRKGLKDLENIIHNDSRHGWVSWTLTSRPHIIRLFTKVGAKPFQINLKSDDEGHVIWFKKTIGESHVR